jgi:Na+/proline symporter
MTMGGFSNIISATPPEFFSLTPEHTLSAWLTYIAAWMAIGLGSIPQQDVYQRAMSAKSAKIAQWASVGGGLLYFTIVLIPLFLGLAASQLHPELLAEGADAQMLLPTLIGEHTGIIVQIFFFGALLSAIMSTASAALLAPATLIAENVVRPFFPGMTDTYKMHIIQTSIVVVALGAITLAIQQGDVYELVGSAYSITLVSALVPLTFGLYWKKANNLGALLAIIFGFITWQYLGHTLPEEYVDASTIVGFGMSIVGMLLGVAITHVRSGGKEETVPAPARIG